jgi:transposase
MSLIHTCEMNKANPFDYLTQLQKHANDLSSNPEDWMPWNYCDMLQSPNTS